MSGFSTTPASPALDVWPATALVIGHTIAVGVFLTPAELLGALASPGLTLALWAGCGLVVLAGAFTFGELASRYPLAGGPYIYLREGWGERAAFLYGWQGLLVMDPGVTAALATGVAAYAVVLWPGLQGSERWLAVVVIWLLAGISMSGLMLSARVLAGMTAAKVIAFIAIVVAAFAAGEGSWSHYVPLFDRQNHATPVAEALALGLVAVFFSFGGFWEASRIAGEVRNARRTMPIALGAGVATVTAIYIAITAAFIYLVPVQHATSAPEFARRAGQAMLGPAGPVILTVVVVLSAVASALALLIMAPRLYVAMSSHGLFPPQLAVMNARTGVPGRATALLALLATIFALVGTFQEIVAFFMCTTLSFVALAAAALLVVRRRASEQAPFSSPGYPFTALVFVLLVLAVVVIIAINRPWQAAGGAAIVLLGVPAHRLLRRA